MQWFNLKYDRQEYRVKNTTAKNAVLEIWQPTRLFWRHDSQEFCKGNVQARMQCRKNNSQECCIRNMTAKNALKEFSKECNDENMTAKIAIKKLRQPRMHWCEHDRKECSSGITLMTAKNAV